MTTDQWLTLGIYTASVVFALVGFFIVRELRRNDKTLEVVSREIRILRDHDSRKTTRLKIIELALMNKHILPPTMIVPFQSPADDEESA